MGHHAPYFPRFAPLQLIGHNAFGSARLVLVEQNAGGLAPSSPRDASWRWRQGDIGPTRGAHSRGQLVKVLGTVRV